MKLWGGMDNERRKHNRHSVNQEFSEIVGHMAEYVEDVSKGGVFLRCDDPLPVGTRVQLRFSILSEDVETIEGVGEVVNQRSGDKIGMGIRFVSLTDASKRILAEFCKETD